VLDLAAAWRLVSTNPAAAAGLPDRGRIAPGLRGDVLLVEDRAGVPALTAVFAAGRLAWLAPEAAGRFG
jgi:alpha-D-ribose 1-methylphosphonate 5-triphosphate diphosphatase